MIKLISRLLLALLGNILALAAAIYFVSGFKIANPQQNILIIAVIFTLLNIFVKPLLKLILSPIIILTFGLGLIVVNAIVLYALEYLTPELQIAGLRPLIYATLIISLVHIIFHFITKQAKSD